MSEPQRTVELFWDVGSTNTYFALKLLDPILQRHDARLVLHPFNLGYVFRKHQYVLMDEPRAKLASRYRDLARWAEKYDLPFRMPDIFPIKTSRALRGALVMRRWELERPYIDAIFSRYWEHNDASIADYAGLRPVVIALGVDGDEFERECESDTVRQALIESTDRGLERGVFGVPAIFVGEELFWGKDRMEFVEDALVRA